MLKWLVGLANLLFYLLCMMYITFYQSLGKICRTRTTKCLMIIVRKIQLLHSKILHNWWLYCHKICKIHKLNNTQKDQDRKRIPGPYSKWGIILSFSISVVLIMATVPTSLSLWSCFQSSYRFPNQSGRSPKVVALFSATNFSSYIIELLQLQDAIQIQWNYAWIHYDITKRSHLMI